MTNKTLARSHTKPQLVSNLPFILSDALRRWIFNARCVPISYLEKQLASAPIYAFAK
jgi:hypothetical protein